jgi:hypothetical protein
MRTFRACSGGAVPDLGEYELIVKRGIYGSAGAGLFDTCPRCKAPHKNLNEFDDGWYCEECEQRAEEKAARRRLRISPLIT